MARCGISHQTNTQTNSPYAPEENGMSEEGVRTVVKKEAVSTAAYVVNHSQNNGLNKQTPHEI